MSALARAEHDAPLPETDSFGWNAVRLSGLLEATADRHPGRLALNDQPNRETWSGRPRIAWTYANTHQIVGRLAAFLAGLGLAPGAPVGICLPNSSEACVAILAVERAGYTACLLPIGWAEDMLGNAIEAAAVSAVICQGRIADERPADVFCRLAARYYGLRFICAFGPQVPDGVIDLDRAILDTEVAPVPEAEGHAGLVTFDLREGRPRPVFRPMSAVVAAAVHYLVTQPVGPGDRILSLLAPDDHRSLTTGLVASLVTGATLESHGFFDSRALDLALSAENPTHLVVPGWLEAAMAQADLPESVSSVVVVHEAPVRFKARGELKRAVTDVLGFGEMACVARARSPSGHLALSLDEADGGQNGILRIRRDEDGSLSFGGAAAETFEFQRGQPRIPAQPPQWRSSVFKADLFAGIVIGVR